jgi:hypothetical protein
VADHRRVTADCGRASKRSRTLAPGEGRRCAAATRRAPCAGAGRRGDPGGGRHAHPAFLCAHPALSPASQVALTLRAVGGLTTAEIARAFLVPDATIAQRISRGKQRIKASGIPFNLPPEPEQADRLRVVLHVLYLIFNEGHTATSGPDLQRDELTAEAIRLTREVRRQLPADGEVAGLLGLMLLTEARRAARSRTDGSLVPLAEQDRSRWNRKLIDEGLALVADALSRTALGPYQLQAAIAAVHAEAARAEDTDWPQILALYELLERSAPNPMVTLNRAVALAMVHGPQAGLDLLKTLLALREGPVGDRRNAVPHAHRSRVRRVGENDGSTEELPGRDQPLEKDVGVAVVLVPLGLRQCLPRRRVVVNERDVLHASLLSWIRVALTK